MARFRVVLVRPTGYIHSLALAEIARLLVASFESLGHHVSFAENELEPASINIILGYHLWTKPPEAAEGPFVVYQLEQLSDNEGWWTQDRLQVLKSARRVWDYSPANLDFLRSKGITHVDVLPIGFHEKLQTISRRQQTTDVLFFGSLNDRRRDVLNQLAERCQLRVLFGVFGDERDAAIGDAKIVLNIHYYEAQIMEQARISYLLNNQTFVISESSAENPYEGGIIACPYDQLVGTVLHYLGQPSERFRIARAGYKLFASRPMTGYLRDALSLLLRSEEPS